MDQWSFTSPFEGVVPHLYLDSVGLVTCGVGFMVPDLPALKRLPWSPSSDAAVADWQLVRAAERGHTARWYAQFCKARLPDRAMRQLFDQRVDEFRRQLRGWLLERFPEPVQIALIDMAYNLGVGGLNKYVKLRAALGRGDLAMAAEQCERRGVQPARNAATRALFLSVARS